MEKLQHERRLILGTDLDGTFLGGDRDQRRSLYRWLNNHRDHWLLVFVTGRSCDLVRALYQEPDGLGLPTPDFVIADVGTTVTDWRTGEPVAAVQDWIADCWGDGADCVAALLDNCPGVRLQSGTFAFRRSYFCDDGAAGDRAAALAQAAGFDAVRSDGGRFLDVLPRGVSKGPTLLKLLELLQLPPTDAVVAGDTLNDWSMLTCGVPAIAVGNSEPSLVERLHGMPTVYQSPEPGAAGIADGLQHFGRCFGAVPKPLRDRPAIAPDTTAPSAVA